MLNVIGDTVGIVRLLYLCLLTSWIARDYVEGMWLMLQQPTPEDFVLATGETHPVREFVNKSFAALDIELKCAAPLLALFSTYTRL